MGALYEDVETFFGDIFACYGRAVSRFPHPFTVFPLVFCILLGLGLFSIRYETNIENLYSPINSQAQKDRQQILKLFDSLKVLGNHSEKQLKNENKQTNFKYHQQIHQPTYFEIIVFNKDNSEIDLKSENKVKEDTNVIVHINESHLKYGNFTKISNSSKQTSFRPEHECSWNSTTVQLGKEEDEFDAEYKMPSLSPLTANAIRSIRILYKCIATFRSPKTSKYDYFEICSKFNNQCSVDVFEVKETSANTCAYSSNQPKATKKTTLHNKNSRNSILDTEAEKSRNNKRTTPILDKNTIKITTLSTVFTYSIPRESSNEYFQNISLKPSPINIIRNNSLPKKKPRHFHLPYLNISPLTIALKIRFNLKEETRGEARQRHLRWQEAAMEQMIRFKDPYIRASFMASDSLEIELQDHVGGDTKYFGLSVVAMLVSATFAGSGGSADHVVLAYTGVVAALLTILGTFGLLSLIGTSFVNLCSVMPFLVLGVGVDDMLQLLVEWRKTASQEERLSKTLRLAAVSITITSLTDLLVFCIGATSPFLSVRNFCACSGVGIFLCYLNQLTFFSGCIVLISRHCKCLTKKNKNRTSNITDPNIGNILNNTSLTTTTFIELETMPNERTNSQNIQTKQGYELVSTEENYHDKADKGEYQLQEISDGDDSTLPASSLKVITVQSLNNLDSEKLTLGNATKVEFSESPSTSMKKKTSIESFGTIVNNVLISNESVSEPTTPTRFTSSNLLQNTKTELINDIQYEDTVVNEDNSNYHSTKCCSCFQRCLKYRDKKCFEDERSGVCELFVFWFSKYYPKVLLHWVGKTITVFIFLTYVGLSIRGVTKLEEGLNLEDLVPPEEYYKYHQQVDTRLFPNCGIVVTFVIYKPITYHKAQTREKLKTFLESVDSSEFIVSGSSIAWFSAYSSFLSNKQKKKSEASDFGRKLKDHFLPRNPQYKGDISFSKHANSPWVIDASRFYFVCHRTNKSEDQKDLMLALRAMAANSSLPMKAFSPQFVFYEHYASIIKNTLLPVGVTIIGMLFVALVFIPHPIAVLCVIGSMASTVVGMMGFMYLCGLALSAITTMQIILGVGVCVSYTVRTSHAFMTATGKSRNERVTSALVKVGASILTGASCSFFSSFSLYYGTSFIFSSFFKTTAFALFLGVLHSIVFLPVMLSFVGPRRTGKPRLFIPVHAANPITATNTATNSSKTESRKPTTSLSDDFLLSRKTSASKEMKPCHSKVVQAKSSDLSIQANNEIKDNDSVFGKDETSTKILKPNKVSFKLNDINKKSRYSINK